MDDSYRMRLKIGAHEFEAEGPVNVVQEQVKRFMDLIASLPASEVADTPLQVAANQPPAAIPPLVSEPVLDKIMKIDNRVISLTARPESGDDAVLLLLYGQKMLRSNDSVTGSEVIEGVTTTGGLSILRVDRLLEKLAKNGDVIVIGERRGKRYRLTNSGFVKARKIATDLVAIVA